MIKDNIEPSDIERKVHDLAKAMRAVRTSQADFNDDVIEAKQARLSRLELLSEDLESVISDIPNGCNRFEFAITRGESPRLWIDIITFVRLVGDGRDYELVKDSRMGRVVLARDSSRQKIGEEITSYIAERLLERERMIEGDWVFLSQSMEEKHKNEVLNSVSSKDIALEKESTDLNTKTNFINKTKHSNLSLVVWFLLGLLSGAIILFVLNWFGLMEKIIQGVN